MRPVRKEDILPPSCAVETKFANLNFLELFGPVQGCNGTALSLPFTTKNMKSTVFSNATMCDLVNN